MKMIPGWVFNIHGVVVVHEAEFGGLSMHRLNGEGPPQVITSDKDRAALKKYLEGEKNTLDKFINLLG